MRISPALALLLSLGSWSTAFQGYQGFSFGNTTTVNNQAWGIARQGSGYFVAGGITDSSCCNQSGTFNSGETSFGKLAWTGSLDQGGKVTGSESIWAMGASRWFGLETQLDGSIITVGPIMDTVLFDGKSRITRNMVTPDTMSYDSLFNSEVILNRGGYGGIGIAHWDASGNRNGLRLFRIADRNARASLGWDVHASANGHLTLAGTTATDSVTVAVLGSQSFPVQSGPRAFLAGMNADGSGAWFQSAFPCVWYMHASHARTAKGLWLAQGDSVFPSDSGPTPYAKYRPILVRYDTLGHEFSRSHPLRDMKGAFFAIASHENGSLLLQGEQSSDLVFQGSPYPLIMDTAIGLTGMSQTRSSFLLLTDSLGKPLKVRSLSGIGYTGDWKILRAPGKGWLLQGWDARDMIGWSRSFLLDDSLNVMDVSDTLPAALGVSLDGDSGILMTTRQASHTFKPSWLKGEGSMWAASFRWGSPTTRIQTHEGSAIPIQRHGSKVTVDVEPGATVRVQLLTPHGRVLLQREMHATGEIELPRGLSLLRVSQGGKAVVQTFVR